MAGPKDIIAQSGRRGPRNRRIAVDIEKDRSGLFNTLEAIRTTIDTSAKKIDVPEDAIEVIIYHNTASTDLFVGKDDTITAISDSAPLADKERLRISVKKGNDNNIYGVVSSGSITVYAIGLYRE